MKTKYIIIVIAILVALCSAEVASAQKMPERHLVRKGNRQYERGEIEKSIENYNRALAIDPTSFEAAYDLGSALFRAERYDKAEQTLTKVAADSLRTNTDRADAAFNLGNNYFAQKKYQEALDCYRKAMRLNPDDKDAKYNYAYTKLLMQAQQNQQNQDQQNQDQQNQDQQQNQNQQDQQNSDQNQDKEQGDQQEQQGENQPQEQQGDQQEGESQPCEGAISPQEQAAMLDAIQAQEDKTQEKLKEKKGILIRGRKNW